MSDIAIRVEHLSKQYRIGGSQAPYQTLRETIVGAVRKPLKVLSGESKAGPEKIWALNDVSFEIKRGEVVGVIGRNGAGKSTLLKILSHITSPTKGRVEIHGRVGSLLEVGTGFHNELTGRENIYLNGAILGMTRAEIARKFDEIVDFAEIEKFLDTPVKHYSSGMYMRLAFAVAAHLEPEILLVDEVLAVGDAEFQKKCLGKMGEVAGEGRTVLFVSHNMGAIQRLCHKSMLLENGTINLFGETEKAIDLYFNSGSLENNEGLLLRNRQGSGEVRFKNVRLVNNGKPTNKIYMGDPLEIEIDYVVYSPVENPIVGVLIEDNLGKTIIRAYSRESKPDFINVLTKDGTICCRFQNTPLMSGKYYVRLWLGHMRNTVIDDVQQTCSFDVIQSDVYGTGVLPDYHNGGVCYAEHEWKII